MHHLSIGIVGTGPAALMAGTALLESGHNVHFFDQLKAPARKFLVAGHGGFNLTHSEMIDEFVNKYDSELLRESVRDFTSADFIGFLKVIGIETYVGSSGKIFPVKGVKPIEVLNAWLDHLRKRGAEFNMEHRLIDFSANSVVFNAKGTLKEQVFDRIIFALGGGSWSRTGSDGKWVDLFRTKGIAVRDLTASNSGFELRSNKKLHVLEGLPIKNCKVYSDRIEKYGDTVLTTYGIEGAPIYALNAEFRHGQSIFIDLKPDLSVGAIGILKMYLTKEEFLEKEILAPRIKKLALPVRGIRPLNEVISSVGGIHSVAIDTNFQLHAFPGIYCIGEMVDWDAPTGGYLIQGSVASGMKAARSILGQS